MHMRLCFMFLLIADLMCAPGFCAENTASAGETISQAKQLYYEGINGNKQSLEKSTRMFSDLASIEPDNPEVQAYHGSILLLQAGRTWAVWKKYELSKAGLASLDEAVRRAPSNLEVRFVRAATTMHLPSFFSRDQQSKEDLTIIAKGASTAVSKHELDARIAAAALFFYAERVVAPEDRKGVLEQAFSLAPDSPAGRGASLALQRMQNK